MNRRRRTRYPVALTAVRCDVYDWLDDPFHGGRWCAIHRTRFTHTEDCPEAPK